MITVQYQWRGEENYSKYVDMIDGQAENGKKKIGSFHEKFEL